MTTNNNYTIVKNDTSNTIPGDAQSLHALESIVDYSGSIIKKDETRTMRFQDIMSDIKNSGRIALREIPVDLLAINKKYQTDARTISRKRQEHIEILVKRWNENKLEPITIVPYPELGVFVVINGYGRLKASQMLSHPYKYLCSTILLSAPSDLEKRCEFEADLFAYQTSEVSPLTPFQKHGANIVLKNQAAILLDKMKDEYNFQYSNELGRRSDGVIGSYVDVFNIAKTHGEYCLRFIFDVCQKAALDRKYNGYASYIIKALKDAYINYPECAVQTSEFISKYFRERMPANFRNDACNKYPLLPNVKMACSVHLEDLLVENIGVGRKRIVEDGKVKMIGA